MLMKTDQTSDCKTEQEASEWARWVETM